MHRNSIFKKLQDARNSQPLQHNPHLRIFLAMASLQKEKSVKNAKADAKGKRKADDMEVDQHVPAAKKPRNKQRVLMLSSRGINHRMRHLMNDLEALLPHVKKGTYMQHPKA